ncbi:hypothetical protein [Rothia sp. P13129]|uniref:hypothetical protein n=1 Tax=unclassified Rothia (in: high G+C Gram-positive bacteria) TaxID=2689056 RepID=UPI003AD25CF7
MTHSESRRIVLKGAALAIPALAITTTAAFSHSTGADEEHHGHGHGGSTGDGNHHHDGHGGHGGHGHGNGGHGHGNGGSTGGHGGHGGHGGTTNPSYPTLPAGCPDGAWRKDIPCASFIDQSNGEGRAWHWGREVSLALSAEDAGPNGYDVQCYIVPVNNDYNRTNTYGNASARFQSITTGSGSAPGFYAGNWSAPVNASGAVIPHSFNGSTGNPNGSDIVLPSGSIMVQAQKLRFSGKTGIGRLNLNLNNRWFSSGKSWVKAIWVIRNNDMGHWHVLDTVGYAGPINRPAYDGKF